MGSSIVELKYAINFHNAMFNSLYIAKMSSVSHTSALFTT